MRCSICYSLLYTGEKKLKVLTCGHVLHMDCFEIAKTKLTQCPLCKKRLMSRHCGPLNFGFDDIPQTSGISNNNVKKENLAPIDKNIVEKNIVSQTNEKKDNLVSIDNNSVAKNTFSRMKSTADFVTKNVQQSTVIKNERLISEKQEPKVLFTVSRFNLVKAKNALRAIPSTSNQENIGAKQPDVCKDVTMGKNKVASSKLSGLSKSAYYTISAKHRIDEKQFAQKRVKIDKSDGRTVSIGNSGIGVPASNVQQSIGNSGIAVPASDVQQPIAHKKKESVADNQAEVNLANTDVDGQLFQSKSSEQNIVRDENNAVRGEKTNTQQPIDHETKSSNVENKACGGSIKDNEDNILVANNAVGTQATNAQQSFSCNNVGVLPVPARRIVRTKSCGANNASNANANEAINCQSSRDNTTGASSNSVRSKIPARRNTTSYDRNIRIRCDTNQQNQAIVLRRSTRIAIPVKRYNCGVVKCSACSKSFRDDIAIDHYAGKIVCSFECFRKMN